MLYQACYERDGHDFETVFEGPTYTTHGGMLNPPAGVVAFARHYGQQNGAESFTLYAYRPVRVGHVWAGMCERTAATVELASGVLA
jgi:hypothetical protein